MPCDNLIPAAELQGINSKARRNNQDLLVPMKIPEMQHGTSAAAIIILFLSGV